MATTHGTAVLAEIHNRLTTLEAGMSGVGNVASRLAQSEMQIAASVSAISNIALKIHEIEGHIAGMMDGKIAAAVAMLTAIGGMQALPQNTSWNVRSILEARQSKTLIELWTRKGMASGIAR